MRLLLVAQEPPLDPGKVVTGNALRAAQLTSSLAAAGHEVIHVSLSKAPRRQARQFRNRDDLRSLVLNEQPDVILVCFWHLLDLLPFDSDIPVVLDFVAPRPLEEIYQAPDEAADSLRRLRLELAKVDLVLVGNAQQSSLLLLPLIEAGHDLRQSIPIAVVPLAAEPVQAQRADPGQSGWTIVTGGVSWPWRRATAWLDALQQRAGEAWRLVVFGGDYALHPESKIQQAEGLLQRPLEPYQQYSAFLAQQSHIGLELSDDNVERRFSQSFRSLDFLRHGLPLICNRYLPIARMVERHDAGWLVDRPEDLPALVDAIVADTATWREKSRNATRLAAAELDPAAAAAPLLEWLEQPAKAPRVESRVDIEPTVLGVPPWRERIGRIVGLARWVLLRKLFSGKASGGIVIVTRGDLFPADHGAAVKIVETARGLASHDRCVGLVTDDRRYWWEVVEGTLERRRLPWFIRILAKPAPLVKLLHFSKDIPQENGFLYLPLTDGSFFWRTLYVGRRMGASVVQAEFPAYVRPAAPAADVLDARTVLVQHNVEYERIRAQVAALTEEQYQRYKGIEIDLCNKCDAVICVSDNDAQRLAVDGVDRERLHVIPHGVDLAQFQLPHEPNVRTRYGIPKDATIVAYHGTFSYPPNAEALKVFAAELMPRFERKGLDIHVLAIGREPPPRSPDPRVHLVGSVDVIGPWLRAADLAVIPLLEGGGTRMKIIDCFAAGLPVISTSKGIEGIPARNGRDALIIDDWDKMADAVERLVQHPAEAQALAEAGRAMAAELDWNAIAGRYLSLFARL